jgi:hypothetical protein
MKVSLKLVESNSQIEKAICVALLPQVTTFFHKVSQSVQSKLPDILREYIIAAPEYAGLVGGKLKLELGVPDAELRLDDIINIWINNAVVKYITPTISNNKIKGSFSIYMVKSDFTDVINNSSAEIEDNISGSVIPWLRWLLLEGTSTIVRNYEVSFGPNSRSRTGFAIMIESDNKDWSVPSEYAGTESDNWITRAINNAKPSIMKLLNEALSQ